MKGSVGVSCSVHLFKNRKHFKLNNKQKQYKRNSYIAMKRLCRTIDAVRLQEILKERNKGVKGVKGVKV